MEFDDKQKYMAVVGAVLLIALGLAIALTVDFGETNINQNGEEEDDNETALEDYDPDNTGEEVEDSIEAAAIFEISNSVSPTRVRTAPGETVAFENLNDFPIRIDFTVEGRTDDEFVINENENLKLSFSAMDDFDVYNENTGDLIGGGFINVQT